MLNPERIHYLLAEVYAPAVYCGRKTAENDQLPIDDAVKLFVEAMNSSYYGKFTDTQKLYEMCAESCRKTER